MKPNQNTTEHAAAVAQIWGTLGALRPPTRMLISDWAAQHRRLSSEDSARTGKFVAFPYQIGIMDAPLEPGIEDVSVMGSAQWGKTVVKMNIMGYFIDQDPCPMMDVEPTLEMANTFSKDRFDPMVRDTPVLTGKVAAIDDKKKKGNAIRRKEFPGGQLTISGSNSPASLAARPVRILLGDDIDRFKITAEGDSWRLAEKRTTGFWNRCRITFTTPTVKDASRGQLRWESSDQRVFMVPCVHCKHKQRLVWAGLKYTLNVDGSVGDVWYECEKCHGKISERHKSKMIYSPAAAWVKLNPKVTNHAGFHISELYNLLSTWKEVVKQFIRDKKDPETLRVWVNTVLGELWEETETMGMNAAAFADRIEDYEMVPAAATILTAAIDVQENRVELLVEGWGKDEECFHVHHQVIPGNFARSSVQRDVALALDRTFKNENGLDMPIDLTVIDSGYMAQTVYKFVKHQSSVRSIVTVKGYQGAGKKLLHKVQQEKRVRVTLIIAGVDEGKEIIYDRLTIEEPGPACIHFNQQCGAEYFAQLTSERRKTKYKYGHAVRVWEKAASARNEILDMKVYNLVAIRHLSPNWDGRQKYVDKLVAQLKQEKDAPPARTAVKKSRRVGSGFVNRY